MPKAKKVSSVVVVEAYASVPRSKARLEIKVKIDLHGNVMIDSATPTVEQVMAAVRDDVLDSLKIKLAPGEGRKALAHIKAYAKQKATANSAQGA